MYKIGQIHKILSYIDDDWIMLAHAGDNKVVAICNDGNRYRDPRAVLDINNISADEFRNIMGRPSIGEGRLALQVTDDNSNYPRPIDRYYIGSACSYGTVLIDAECNYYIVVQTDSSICGLTNSDGELLTHAIRVNNVVDITRHELFEMGATADMYVVGKSYNTLILSESQNV